MDVGNEKPSRVSASRKPASSQPSPTTIGRASSTANRRMKMPPAGGVAASTGKPGMKIELGFHDWAA
jgi:hypothetical protein